MSRIPLTNGGYADAVLPLTSDGLSAFMPAGTVTPFLGTSAGSNLKTSPGAIYAITCSNAGASVLWLQIFNKTSLAVLNDAPIRSFPVLANNDFLELGQDIFGGSGIILSTGISWGVSSTRLTYTAITTPSEAIVTIRWA